MLIERWVQPAGIHVELQTWGVVDLRGCFIWTSWCSWAEGHCLWTSPRKAGMSTALPLMGCFWRSSSNNQGSLQATAVLTHSVLPLFLSLLFGGGRGLWKRSSKHLGWSSDDARNTALDPWPRHPTLKDEATQLDAGLPYSSFPEPGSWQSLPFKTLMHRGGFSPLLDTTHLLLLPEGPTQVWEMEWQWVTGSCWKN